MSLSSCTEANKAEKTVMSPTQGIYILNVHNCIRVMLCFHHNLTSHDLQWAFGVFYNLSAAWHQPLPHEPNSDLLP